MSRTAPRSGIILSGTDPNLPPGNVGEFEKYTDFQEMARGGKALLTECYDRIIGRTVVMKRLLPKFAEDEQEQRRFLREARVTAQLQHPNTVPVYDLGRDDEGHTFFTMKRIYGENFHEILKKIAQGDEQTIEEYPVGRRIEVVADACLALAYAHALGVVHRDVKPENIWVGEYGQVILLDWGIAKVWGHYDDFQRDPKDPDAVPWDESIEVTQQLRTLTQAGQLVGTPLYMSPEQVLGHRYLDERSDIFGAGIVLYEALAIHEPFRGRNIRETFDRIIHEPPTPPHEKSPQYDIPPEASEIALKALSKNADERFQTMLEYVEALRNVARKIEP
ncbi:serine/threonine protein kinase [Stratiformator vulcanicus]|uniref:Serine/threonine-protein kinase PknD n=1 Tax=Stratiformator vulcanicus TaxID=2527980 RepID=A0A517R016_9PLAN|nr:serine/threonine-protein kinase [Stratiformator vulcanicus]QDT37245.1 Serine/threonine-protein kinase PknD [Stratiformator vulcanicus]